MQTQRRQEKSTPARRRERPPALWLLFLYVFPPSGPALCKLGQPGGLFVLPEVLILVLWPSFVLFSRTFPFLVFQPPPFQTPFSYSDYLTYLRSHFFYFISPSQSLYLHVHLFVLLYLTYPTLTVPGIVLCIFIFMNYTVELFYHLYKNEKRKVKTGHLGFYAI